MSDSEEKMPSTGQSQKWLPEERDSSFKPSPRTLAIDYDLSRVVEEWIKGNVKEAERIWILAEYYSRISDEEFQSMSERNK